MEKYETFVNACFGTSAPGASESTWEGPESIAVRKRILLPNARFKSTWDTWILLLVLYNSLSIPIEFGFETEQVYGLKVWDALVDCMFILDILLQFDTAFYHKDGTLELDRRAIAKNYLVSWFPVDLVASIPVDWFLAEDNSSASALGAAKVPRLLRLGRLLKKLDQFTAARTIRVAHILLSVIMLAHWVACIWWKIGVSNSSGWPYSDAVLLNVDDWELDLNDIDLGKKYVTSMYWALTMVVKSPWIAPGTTAEQIFSSFVIIIGTLAFVTFIGTFTAFIASADRGNALYRDQITALRQYAEARSLSKGSTHKLIEYWNQYFAITGGMDEQGILEKIPIHLRPQLLTDMHEQLIKDCPFLAECSSMGCAEFLFSLSPEVCMKGDQLLVAGTTPNKMYILTAGELQVSFPPALGELKVKNVLGDELTHTGGEDRRLSKRVPHGRVERPGSLIGFQPPFGPPKPIPCSVRAVSRSTFLSITRELLASVLNNHPGDAPIFMKAMEHANKVLNPDKRRSVAKEADKEGDKESKSRASSFNHTRGSVSVNIGLPDMQDALQRTQAMQEAVSSGWLPDGYDEGDKPPAVMTAAWMQDREEAEQDIAEKLQSLGAKMNSIQDLLQKVVGDTSQPYG